MITSESAVALLDALIHLCPVPFVKMNGSGNDFVMLDNREAILPPPLSAAFATRVCRRGLSIGADGVVLIDHPLHPDISEFSWRYINADGSDGEMCGNGAMCGATFAAMLGICASACTFETAAGIVRAHLSDDLSDVTLLMNSTSPLGEVVSVSTDHGILALHPIDVGVPHVVAFVDDADIFLSASDFDAVGRSICHHQAFQPAGTNVNIVSLRTDGRLRMRTWERGVNAETLACGTGAIASAVAAVATFNLQPSIGVVTSGGRELRVTFALGPTGASGVKLSGHVACVARGEILPDALGRRGDSEG